MPDIPRSKTWLVLAGTLVLQIAIIRSSTVLRHELHPRPNYGHGHPSASNVSIDLNAGLISTSNFFRRTTLRRALEDPTQSQRTHTLLTLPYSEWYEASSPALKPLVATGYLLLLSFLFSFIGIVASDFFCPNLATISNYLGLSETTAGVTFLAFGNGSPDVFSTFSAMNQGTFSLAIGELIGAATFITSIVVGSIAFIRPFHVPKTAFIRDITFFTAAVIVLVVVLRDGHLTLFESATMVALYALYVVVVIAMNVMAQRGRRGLPNSPPGLGDHGGWKSLPGSGGLSPLVTNGNGIDMSPGRPTSLQLPSPHLEGLTHESDEGSSTGTLTPTGAPTRSRRQSKSGPGSGSRSRSHSHSQAHQFPHQHQHLHMHLQGLSTPDHNHNHYPETPRANFSLLGAVEFRDVVNSLKREQELNSSRAPSPSRSPYTAAERGDYFSAAAPGSGSGSGSGSGGGHRRSVSHAATRRSSTQYRSRAISHVVHPGSMATFTMPPPNEPGVSPKRASPVRTKSAPGPVSPGSVPHPKSRSGSGTGTGAGDHSPKKQTSDPTSDSSSGLSPDTVISPSSSENPWTFQSGNPPNPQRPSLPKLAIPEPQPLLPPKRRPGHGATPSISVVDPSGHIEEPIFSPPRDGASSPPIRLTNLGPGSMYTSTTPYESRWRIRRRIRKTLRVLFPSLQSLRHKSLFGKILSVYSVPAIFVLTLTLPVVDDGNREEGGIVLPEGEDEPLVPDLEPGLRSPHESDRSEGEYEDEDDPYLRPDVGEGLHQLVEGGFSPLHSPLGRIHQSAKARRAELEEEGSDGEVGRGNGEEDEEIEKGLLEEMEEEQALQFNKSLCAAQCVLGPTFCSYIVFGDLDSGPWITLGCFISGLVAAIASIHFGTDGTSRPWRLVRTLAGFTCSMVWIASIADEVVSVLQSIGELMGLSDAIIGLTIFAIGNSMADLVANITVAQFAPAMAYAACFGGPMLNLLLGVGGSGTYHLLSHPHHPVNLHFSPTLWVSATGLIIILLTTAIVVPLNGYLIDRRWAGCLVVAYGVLMVANVVVEVKTGRA